MMKAGHYARFPDSGFALFFWFAMLSPLIGLIFGFLGAWFFSGADSVT
jgi:hypothetical protein